MHGFWAVADQHRAPDRVRDLAVLDRVDLRATEDELAKSNVDLTAADGNGIVAPVGRGDDVFPL